MKGKERKQKLDLVHFDTLRKQEQKPDHSIWQGEKGTYVFEDTGRVGQREPIRKVYLNRTYLSGLFRTRESGRYSGDMKTPEGKQYLLFVVRGDGEVEILRKVRKVA